MEKEQKEILLTHRVELVENLNMEGGLFTQLLAKKVLNQRTVNNIKMKRTPEEQAEELLNFLPKRDCFEKFCEALEADFQDEIVLKYLKAPLNKLKAEEPQKSTPEPVTSPTTARNPTSVSAETIDSAVQPQPVNPQPTISVIKIQEPDNNLLCIEYQNGQSPQKKRRTEENGNSHDGFESDSTRYVNKHYIAQESGKTLMSYDSSLAVVPLVNPQSVTHNANISDPVRYVAAYAHQSSQGSAFQKVIPGQFSSSLASSASRTTLQTSAHSQESQHQDTTKVQSTNYHKSNNTSNGLPRSINNEGSQQYNHPHEYLRQEGLLSSVKYSQPMSGVMAHDPLAHTDSVDTMSLRIQGREISSADGHGILHEASGAAIKLSSLHSSPSVVSAFHKVTIPSSIPDNITCDLESMDLPDGCVNVNVEHTTRQFFLNNFKKSYPMRKIPRGLFLIINVDEVAGKPPRKGTNIDRDNLMNLLCQLHFDPVVYNDSDGLSAQEIVFKLKDFAKRKEHYRADACFICLLSHGEEGYIFGTDGKKIPLDEIFLLFGNTMCKGLMGKPKMFIIQACRGGILDKGVMMDEPDGGTMPNTPTPLAQLPTMSDMLICYPTMTGYYAWRNRARGSWYIEAIVQIFMKYAKCEDVCVMLNRVNQLVSRKVSECNQQDMNQMSQMSEYKSSLRQPHLHLFPGIECSDN